MDLIEGSETSAIINQTPGNYPKENLLYSVHGESLKSRKLSGYFASGRRLEPGTLFYTSFNDIFIWWVYAGISSPMGDWISMCLQWDDADRVQLKYLEEIPHGLGCNWKRSPAVRGRHFLNTRQSVRRVAVEVEWLQFVLIINLTYFQNVFISLLYMFRATQCSSSGESIVSIHHLVYITLCVCVCVCVCVYVCVAIWYAGQRVPLRPDDVLIQLILLTMRTGFLETCREMK